MTPLVFRSHNARSVSHQRKTLHGFYNHSDFFYIILALWLAILISLLPSDSRADGNYCGPAGCAGSPKEACELTMGGSGIGGYVWCGNSSTCYWEHSGQLVMLLDFVSNSQGYNCRMGNPPSPYVLYQVWITYNGSGTPPPDCPDFTNSCHEPPPCEQPCEAGQVMSKVSTVIDVGGGNTGGTCTEPGGTRTLGGCEATKTSGVFDGIATCTSYYTTTGEGCQSDQYGTGNEPPGTTPPNNGISCPVDSPDCEVQVSELPPYYITPPGQTTPPAASPSVPSSSTPGGVSNHDPFLGNQAGGYNQPGGSHTSTPTSGGTGGGSEPETVSWGAFPSLPQGGWYQKKYTSPSLVYANRLNEISNTPFFRFLGTFQLPAGTGQRPVWHMNLNLGSMGDWGDREFSIPEPLWLAAKAIILISALIYARNLIFGG